MCGLCMNIFGWFDFKLVWFVLLDLWLLVDNKIIILMLFLMGCYVYVCVEKIFVEFDLDNVGEGIWGFFLSFLLFFFEV